MPATDPNGTRLRVVYVTSVSYSGSTLLDLLLSSHSNVASLGDCNSPPVGGDCGGLLGLSCGFGLLGNSV